MSDLNSSNILDVTMEELPEEFKELIEEAGRQFQRKCLMSFSKNKSNKVVQKQLLPRVLLHGQRDYVEEEKTRRMSELMYKVTSEAMTNHHTSFLNTFRVIMMNVFGPEADKVFEENTGPLSGPLLFNVNKNQNRFTAAVGGSGSKDDPAIGDNKLKQTCGQASYVRYYEHYVAGRMVQNA